MKVGIDISTSLKIIIKEVMNYEFIDLKIEVDLSEIKIVVLDITAENLDEKIFKYKGENLKIIVLVGENDIREMRKFLLNELVDDCVIRKDIFELEESIQKLEKQEINYESFYLCDSFKRGIFEFKDINYITYSSVSRKTEFHLTNSEIFYIKKNFSEVEEQISNNNIFYKLDRGTIINIPLVEILDFKEEIIIFKNRDFIYTSKSKLKEIEKNCHLTKGRIVL